MGGDPGAVLVTSRSFATGAQDPSGALAAAGLTVLRAHSGHDLAELRPLLADAVAWIAGTGPVTAAHLACAPRLRIVARYGVGLDSVDLAAARARRVWVTHTPGANTAAVADHAVGLLLALLRQVVVGDRWVRAGRPGVLRGRELGGVTVGIAGVGRTGRAMIARLGGFGARVLGYDPYLAPAEITVAGAAPVAGIDELAQQCEVVSLHAPGGRTLVTAPWLEQARPGVMLVNTARSELVDERALAAAMRAGQVGGYATDVLGEPAGRGTSPLLAPDLADRVVVTPHVAAHTVEAIDRMGGVAVADVLAVLGGGRPSHPAVEPR